MAVRIEMADLIELVRGLINDPAGADSQPTDEEIQDELDIENNPEGTAPQFTDEEIQNKLDLEREYYNSLALIPLPEPDKTVYKWHTPFHYWDKGVVLSDSVGTVFVPSQANYLAGQFTLDEAKDEMVITGFCYDVYAVSADLLVLWAGRIEREVTKFSADGSSFEFAGESESKMKLAYLYNKRSKKFGGAKVVGMVRYDHFTN